MKSKAVRKSTNGTGIDDSRFQEAISHLESSGLRLTQPRKTLLELLVSEHGPFSVDEIRELPAARSLDRVTIYRCLQVFDDLGIVRRCEFGDGVSRYEYASRDHHHHHVICRKCRKMENIDDCIAPELLKAVESLGYSNVTHSLEFFGICPNCTGKV